MDVRTTYDLVTWLKDRYPSILSEYQTLGDLRFIEPVIQFEPERFKLRVGDQDVQLSRNELKLFSLLWSKWNEIFTKEDIVRAVWDTHYLHRIDDLRITKMVFRVRAKHPELSRRIVSINRLGYKLCL